MTSSLLRWLNGSHAPHGACGLKFLLVRKIHLVLASCPAWGMWIEIFFYLLYLLIMQSCPAWGMWIEMTGPFRSRRSSRSCPAWGMWIEIASRFFQYVCESSHAPHGACGLKLQDAIERTCREMSCPAWGMWIEICYATVLRIFFAVMPRMGHVD